MEVESVALLSTYVRLISKFFLLSYFPEINVCIFNTSTICFSMRLKKVKTELVNLEENVYFYWSIDFSRKCRIMVKQIATK